MNLNPWATSLVTIECTLELNRKATIPMYLAFSAPKNFGRTDELEKNVFDLTGHGMAGPRVTKKNDPNRIVRPNMVASLTRALTNLFFIG